MSDENLLKGFESRMNVKFDALTDTMVRSFERVYAELDRVEQKLDQKIDYRFNALSNRIDAMNDDKVSYKIFYKQNKVFDDRLTALENTP